MATVYEEHGRIGRFFSSQDPLERAIRRPWTAIADFFTGVVERKESSTYNSALLREWVKDVDNITFKNAARGTHGYDKRYVVRGTEDEILATINTRYENKEKTHFGMQMLRRRNGAIKITVNGDTLDL